MLGGCADSSDELRNIGALPVPLLWFMGGPFFGLFVLLLLSGWFQDVSSSHFRVQLGRLLASLFCIFQYTITLILASISGGLLERLWDA